MAAMKPMAFQPGQLVWTIDGTNTVRARSGVHRFGWVCMGGVVVLFGTWGEVNAGRQRTLACRVFYIFYGL